jgi:starch synthase
MSRPLRVLFAAAEVVPYAKVGGLADVAGALPKALAASGLDVRLIMPLYGSISKKDFGIRKIQKMSPVAIPPEGEKTSFWQATLPDSEVQILFVENRAFFGRAGIYAHPQTGQGYDDNALRFSFYNRALVEYIRGSGWIPDILHGNDYHCGLIPVYLRTRYGDDPVLQGIKTVFSIHNLAYQGRFPMDIFSRLDLPDHLARPMGALEFFGDINYMKAGLIFSDVLNTVSERYAQEIQESGEYGAGLEGVLRSRSADLYGILNGVDYSRWNPETDAFIVHHYSREDLSGKENNKAALLKTFQLPQRSGRIPLMGMISRLADQKGFDLLLEKAEQMMQLDLQLVILGTGQKEYHRQLQQVAQRYPDKLGLALTFDNALAHQIEAGADLFLMPSRYEPCGLNQLYSLRYGAIPVVRATGGLADTVTDVDAEPESGNGFVFDNYDAEEMMDAIARAIDAYADQSEWQRLVKRAMGFDFSWARSAERYRQLYGKALQK